PRRACRLLGGAALALFMVSAFTPAANLLAAWLAGASVVAPAEAIVVLGAGGGTLDDGLPDSASLRRALRGILPYRAGPARQPVAGGAARVGPRRLPRAPRTTLLPGRGIPLTARPA